ncbi:MAG TPA: hypothetical protein VIT21_05375 [Chthoniobacterales bacterium]
MIRKLFWLALFVVFTFGFVVIFEHGVADFPNSFPDNAKVEYEKLQKLVLPSR